MNWTTSLSISLDIKTTTRAITKEPTHLHSHIPPTKPINPNSNRNHSFPTTPTPSNNNILDLFLHYRKPTPPPQNNKIWARTRIKNTNRYERTTTRIKNKSRRSRGGRWSRQWLRKCLRPPYSLVCTSWPRPPCRDAEGVGVSVGSATWGVKGYFRWRRRRRQKSLQVEEGKGVRKRKRKKREREKKKLIHVLLLVHKHMHVGLESPNPCSE